jgi:hypothetical protein
MNKRIKRISPLQLGVVLATFYAALSLLFFVPFILLFALIGASMPMMPANSGQSIPMPAMPAMPAHGAVSMGVALLLAIFVPCVYAALGFILGIISAAIYNLIAMLTGGIEFTVEDVA